MIKTRTNFILFFRLNFRLRMNWGQNPCGSILLVFKRIGHFFNPSFRVKNVCFVIFEVDCGSGEREVTQ